MSICLRRREFIAGLGGAAAWPLAARGQQRAMPVIGYLGAASPDLWADRLRAFRQGLGDTGYTEGRNVTIEYRWADGSYDRFPDLVADLIRRRVSVITAPGSTPGTVAAKTATSTIPIVFGTAADPVEIGLVASLNRPGGNVTGVTALSVELEPKQLALLHEVAPAATIVGLLVNPTATIIAEPQSANLQAAARALGLQFHVLPVSDERDLDGVFATLLQLRAGGLLIAGEAFFTSRSELLAGLALRYRMPAIYQFREFAVAGGLMSYGPNLLDIHRLVGVYVGRILKGDKPAELPVQQPTKFDFVINLKTAKALGLTVPPTVFALATEIVE
jgi:putative ABC transport system substrate-binding protein